MTTSKLYIGDCLDVLNTLDENGVDTCITDPPYHLTSITKRFGKEGSAPAKFGKDGAFARASAGFMGKQWDGGNIAADPATWEAVYRVLKPGALLLAFGGTRTYHRMVCAIEDAGFEIRDCIAWVYGSGFPKSHDISKGIDKQAGAEREVLSSYEREGRSAGIMGSKVQIVRDITAPSTPEAQLWDGWGTTLKPAHEPIVVAMKPIDGTFVNNALTWGVAGMWIDGGRIGTEEHTVHGKEAGKFQPTGGNTIKDYHEVKGRFPANLIHDGSDEVLECFPNDAQRFFYSPKASRSERNAGLEGMEEKQVHPSGNEWGKTTMWNGENGDEEWRKKNPNNPQQNHHPTVKPIELMRYLVRLTKTPTGGVVLDPFMGSGTTGCACTLEGRDFIGIEKEPEYFEIAEKRINYWSAQPPLL